LYHLRAYPSKEAPSVVGGAAFSLRWGSMYLEATLKDSNKRWAKEWFVVANPAPSLPLRTSYPSVLNDKWEEMPSEEEIVQVRVPLAELTRLKAEKLTGAMALSFSKRLTQPIQDRVHPRYEYSGRDEPTRVRNHKVSRREALSRVTRIVSGDVCNKSCPKAYCLKRPTTKVRSASFIVDSIFFRVDFSIGVLLILKFIIDSTRWVVTLPRGLWSSSTLRCSRRGSRARQSTLPPGLHS
jgi:hypothetical protein